MTHSHSHADHHHVDHAPMKSLWLAAAITLTFMAVEFVGGKLSSSLALISDSIHMLSDGAGLLLSLLAVWISRRPKNPRMSFGFVRAEILAALANGVLVCALAGTLAYQAYLRLQTPQAVTAPLVMGIGSLGLVVNLLCLWILHKEQKHSLNVRGAYLHVASDLLGSLGALASGVAIYFTGIMEIDAWVTFFISGLILWSAGRLILESVTILMESVPENIELEALEKSLKSLAGVRDVHHLHVWTLASGKVALSVHLVSSGGDKTLDAAQKLIREKYGISHTTIQIENSPETIGVACKDC